MPVPDTRPIIRHLGRVPYESTWQSMRAFTDARAPATADEIWLLEHPPVFTLGQAGRPEHILDPGNIPVVRTDRGGQITYHGPGQLVAYVLLDLHRRRIGARRLVETLEKAVIALAGAAGIKAFAKKNAPGVYVAGKKLAALGLRIRRGCCYHGLSLNVDMDLAPFNRIDPCGYPGLRVTQLADLGVSRTLEEVEKDLEHQLLSWLGMPCIDEITRAGRDLAM